MLGGSSGSSASCIAHGWLSVCLLVTTPGDIKEPSGSGRGQLTGFRWPLLTLVGPDALRNPFPAQAAWIPVMLSIFVASTPTCPLGLGGSWRSCAEADCGRGIEVWGQHQPTRCLLCVIRSFVSQRPKPCVSPCLQRVLLWGARGLRWAGVEVARLGTGLCHLLAGTGQAGQGWAPSAK